MGVRWRALKNKTTKLDKIYRSVLCLSRMKFCEGLESLSDDLLPIHLRRYAIRSSGDITD